MLVEHNIPQLPSALPLVQRFQIANLILLENCKYVALMEAVTT